MRSPASVVASLRLVLGEHLTGNQLVGMLLIGIGLAALDGRPLAALRRGRGS